MAVPSLTYAASRTTVSGTTFTPTLPSGTGRVFVPVSCPSNTVLTTTSTDWRVHRNELNGTTLGCTWFVSKVAAGASPGALVVTSAASTLFSTVAIRSNLVRTRFIFGVAVTGTAANANPGIVDQLTSRATRYVEVLTLAGTGVATAASSGYSNLTTQAGFTSGASTCVADKSATSSSDDPAAWTNSSAAYITQTIALLDAGTAWNDDWNAAVWGLTTNGVNIAVNFWGDSLTAGATAASGGMAANQIATARPALFAANLTAGYASSQTWEGCGGANVTSGQLNSYDNRRTPGAAWDTSRNSGVNSLGGGALTGPTSGQVLAFVPGGSWNRHRVLFAQYSGSPQYTTKIDSGTATTLLMNQVTSAIAWSPAVSGSGTTINITSAGSGGYILATEAYTSGTPQVSVFNCGWFGSTSTQNTETANFYSPPYVAAALAAKLTVVNLISNDPSNGVTTAQTVANNQFMCLVGLITGSVVLETPPYASGGTETAQSASFDIVEALADALCVGFFRISNQTGWTSYAIASANGYMTSGDNHCSTAGYANWSGYELAYMDPGPNYQAGAGTSAGTSTASAVGSAVKATVGAAAGLATALAIGAAVIAGVGSSAGSSTVSGVGNGLAQSAGSSAGFSTASATTNSIFAGVGSSVGTGTVSGVGSAISAANGSSAGTSTANGVGQGTGQMVGSAAGTSTASGVGASVSASTGSAAGTSTATGLSSATATISGTGTSAGTSTANGVLSGLANMVGTSAGNSTANGVSAGTAIGTGLAAGSSSSGAVGAVIMASTGNAVGTSSAAGNITALRLASGQAVGTSFALAASNPLSIGTGTAQGTSTAMGAGASSRPPDPAPVSRTLYVAYEDRAFPIAFENRKFLVSPN